MRPAREFSRNDRVVTWSPGGLSVFGVAETTPLATSPDISDQPLGVAWAGKSLAVWTAGQVALLAEKGSVTWKTDLHGLTAVAVASGAEALSDQPAEGDLVVVNGQAIINRGQARLVVQNGRQFIIQGGAARQIGFVVANAPGQPAAGQAGPVEDVISVRPQAVGLL